MERDLRLIQRKRMEKAIADGTFSEESPRDVVHEGDDKEIQHPSENMGVDEPPQVTEQPPEHPEQSGQPKQTPLEPSPQKQISQEAPNTAAALPQSGTDEALATGQGMPQDSENSMGLAISLPTDDGAKPVDNPINSEAGNTDLTANASTSLDIADGGDIDFESMFNDTDLVGNDPLNFDIGFSADPAMTQNMLNDNNFEDIAISNTDITTLPATANEDIDSLLPGVENYLNADTDFSNIDMPQPTTVPGTSQAPAVNGTTAPTQDGNAATSNAADNTLDDSIFGFGDFGNGEAGGDDLPDATFGDFEDFDWTT